MTAACFVCGDVVPIAAEPTTTILPSGCRTALVATLFVAKNCVKTLPSPSKLGSSRLDWAKLWPEKIKSDQAIKPANAFSAANGERPGKLKIDFPGADWAISGADLQIVERFIETSCLTSESRRGYLGQ